MTRFQLRAFAVNHPGAAVRLLSLIAGVVAFGVGIWLAAGGDPEGWFLAWCFAVVLLVIASGEAL